LALRHALPPRERGSFAVRQLYGIEEVVSRPDLGDRAIFLTLPPIGETQRRFESELWREFEIAPAAMNRQRPAALDV